MKEYRDLTADPLQETITAGPVSEDNMLEWEALIQGPEGTPYASVMLGEELMTGGGGFCGQASLCERRLKTER
jgi:ubiquitin-conjugating enzyme E2 G2